MRKEGEYNRSMIGLPDHPLVSTGIAWTTSVQTVTLSPDQYCESRDRMDRRIGVLRNELRKSAYNENATLLLGAVASEIGGNSFDHNLGQWKDIPGVLFAHDIQKESAMVVLGDRGQGILTTLQKVRSELQTDEEALKTAFLERISARAPERRGNGLKFVRKTMFADGIDLLFQSGMAQYAIVNKLEDWGTSKVSVLGCLAILIVHP